jgi:hypothetical protein
MYKDIIYILVYYTVLTSLLIIHKKSLSYLILRYLTLDLSFAFIGLTKVLSLAGFTKWFVGA